MTTEQSTPLSRSTYRLITAISALHTLSLELSAQRDTGLVLRRIIQYAVDLLDADAGGAIYLYDPSREGLVLTAATEIAEPFIGVMLRPGEGLAGRVFASGTSQVVNDYPHWEGRAPVVAALDCQSVMSVPLRWQDEVIGTLQLSTNEQARPFTSEDILFAELFAFQASIAIGNMRMIDTAQRRIGRLDALRAIFLEMLSATEIKHILRLIARAAQEHAHAQDVATYLYDQASNTLTFGAAQWADGTIDREYATPRPDGITMTVAQGGKRVVVVDPRRDPLFAGAAYNVEALTAFISVPFRRGDEVLGVMNIAYGKETALDTHLLNFLELLAAQAAVAIHNARLFAATEHRAVEFDRLRTVAVEMLSTNDVSSLLRHISREAVEHCGAEDVRIYLYDSDADALTLASSLMPDGGEGIAPPRAAGLTATVARTGQRIVVNHPETHPLYVDFHPQERDWLFNTIVGVPLKRGGDVVGVFNAVFDQPVSDEVLGFLDLLAAQTSVALQSAQLFEAERDARVRADAVLKASLTLSSTLSLSDLLNQILQECGNVLPLCSGAIMIYDENDLSVVAITGHEGREAEVIELIHQKMHELPNTIRLRSGDTPVIVQDTSTDPLWVDFEPTRNIRCWMGIPLVARGVTIGILSLDSGTPHAFTAGHVEMAQALAAHAAIAIENARLLNRTQDALAQVEEVFKASQRLIAAEDTEGALRAVAAPSLEAGNCNAAFLYALSDPDGSLHGVEFIAATSEPDGPGMVSPGTRMALADHLLGRTILNQPYSLVAVSDVLTSLPPDDPSRAILAEMGGRALAIMPVFLGERLLGWLVLAWSEPHDFVPAEQQYYRVLAPQIAAIMENRRLFDQTRLAEQRFRDIAFSTSDWVWETDEFSRLIYCSEQVTDSTGYTPEEMIGHTPYDLMAPDEAARLRRIIAYYYDRKERFEGLEFWGPHKDGHRVDLVVSGIPIIDPRRGEVIGFRGVTKNITEQRRAEQRDRLAYEVGQRMTSVLSLEELTTAVVGQLQQTFDYYHATLFMYEEATKTLRLRKSAGVEDALLKAWQGVVPLDMHPSLLAKCARERQPVISNDVLADPDYLSSDLLPHTRSEAALPLMHGDRLIGVLDVQADEPGRFTEAEVRALHTLSAHVSIAIENARLYEAERTARARADALRDASRVLSSTLSLEEVLQSILNQCAMIVPFTSSAVMIYQNDTPTVAAMAGSLKLFSLPPLPELAQILYDGPILIRIRETREAIIVPDVLKDPNWIPFPDPTIGGCWMGVPLIARDRMTGILMLLNEQPHAYGAEHLEFVQGLAGHAALAIENAQLYEALERQASHLEDLVQERTAEVVRQREQLRAIVESAGEAIIFTDPHGLVEYANPAWERLSGHSPEYVRGQRAALLFGGNEAMYAEVKAVVLEGRGWSGDVHTRRTDGSEYDIAVTVAPVLDADGALVNVVGVFRDITAQKEVERMRRNFLTSISHELRTPITNMKLFHRLLQTGAEERRQDYLDTLSGEVDRLERLIEDLLDISRIDRGLPAMNPEPLDLNEIVREVQRAHAFRAEERGLALDLDLYDSMPPITGDRQRFMQVLVNLLANAINYTNRGGRIGVRTALRNEDGGPVAVVSVWDTGIGIAPQDLPFVFNRFFRATNAKVEGVPGTGLGLSIVQEIVEMHGGRITVESTPGSGTTFTVTLPIHEMGEEPESAHRVPA